MAAFEYGIDVSSHQQRDLSETIALENPRPTHVVVRMYLPEESPSRQNSIDQVKSARAAGCSAGAYLWAYRSLDARKSVRDAVALAKECGIDPLPVIWIDCEIYKSANGQVDPGPNADWLRAAVDECTKLNVQAGIYTGGWWWRGYLGNTTEFADLPLWTAQYYDGVADPGAVDLYGGFKMAHAKQWNASGLDRDVFLTEVTGANPLQPHTTLEELEAANPNIRSQLRIWQKDQVIQEKDPFDYAVFRQFQLDIGAPDTGDEEFIGFHRPRIEDLEIYNPNIRTQLVDWQILQSNGGKDPLDYEAFRKFQIDIFAPDPGSEFIGFLRATIGELEERNPNIRSQLVMWRQLRADHGLDPMNYDVFRQFQLAIGAPDPGPWEFDGFRP